MTPYLAATTLTVAALALAIYAATCAARPFTRCRRCAGTGTRPRPLTGRLAPCRHCHSSGYRRRTGRTLYHAARRAITDARTPNPTPAPVPDWNAFAHLDPDAD